MEPGPFGIAASACGLEPALVLPTPGDTDAHEVLPTFRGMVGSTFKVGGWGVVECDSLGEETFWGTSFLGREIGMEEVTGEDLPDVWVPAPVSPGRAFLSTLSACSRLLSWAGVSIAAETLLAGAFTTVGPLLVGVFTTVETLLVEVFTKGGTLPLGGLTTVGTLLVGAFTTVVVLLVDVFTTKGILPLGAFTTVGTLLVEVFTTGGTLLVGLLLDGAGAGFWKNFSRAC